MIVTAKSVPIKFGGGLNTLEGPLSIADNQSPNCKNVHSNVIGTLQRRDGNTNISTAANGTTGNGLFDYWKDSSTHFLMAYCDTYLYKMDASGDVLDNTLDTVTFATAMSDAIMEFATFNEAGTNYLIMSTHSRDVLQKWDGTTCSDLSADADLPASKYIKPWKGYLFCANVSGYESRVYYNTVSGAISGATDWATTYYQDIRTHDGDHITGLAVLKGRLYTFKRWSIHRWTYYGGTPLFGIKTSVSGIGAASSKSIVNITHPKYGEVLVFQGSDGNFYIFDGSQAIAVSSLIENDNGVSEFSLARLNMAYVGGACGFDYKQRHWYVCWVPVDTYNDWYVIWDYYNNTWWPCTGIDARCCGIIQNAGAKNGYIIQDDGKVNKFDDGNSDNTSDISAAYSSKKFNHNDQPLLKRQHYINYQFKATGDYSINYQRRSDWAQAWDTAQSLSLSGGGFILGTSLLGTGLLGGSDAINVPVDLPVINHNEQFKLSTLGTDPSWAVYGADIVVEGAGYGKSES